MGGGWRGEGAGPSSWTGRASFSAETSMQVKGKQINRSPGQRCPGGRARGRPKGTDRTHLSPKTLGIYLCINCSPPSQPRPQISALLGSVNCALRLHNGQELSLNGQRRCAGPCAYVSGRHHRHPSGKHMRLIINLVFQMEKQRLGKAKSSAQRHTAGEWQSRGLAAFFLSTTYMAPPIPCPSHQSPLPGPLQGLTLVSCSHTPRVPCSEVSAHQPEEAC